MSGEVRRNQLTCLVAVLAAGRPWCARRRAWVRALGRGSCPGPPRRGHRCRSPDLTPRPVQRSAKFGTPVATWQPHARGARDGTRRRGLAARARRHRSADADRGDHPPRQTADERPGWWASRHPLSSHQPARQGLRRWHRRLPPPSSASAKVQRVELDGEGWQGRRTDADSGASGRSRWHGRRAGYSTRPCSTR